MPDPLSSREIAAFAAAVETHSVQGAAEALDFYQRAFGARERFRISFPGSTAIGREVMSAASDTLKRILLELGGKSASIVLDDTVVTDEMLQHMLFESCSLHSGQACILHSRLLLPDSLHDDVVDRLVALARDVKVGNPADPDVQMGPLISAAQRDRVQAHVDGAIKPSRDPVLGGI